jgi:formamidopyrimidine-DNA glycosylase
MLRLLTCGFTYVFADRTLANMPELPEIEALSERLHARYAGAALERAEPLSFAGLKTVTPGPETLHGRTLESVGYRGKFLVLAFPPDRMLIHLSQGGRIDIETGKRVARPKNGVVRLRFDRDAPLLVKEWGTERKAGWWVLADGDEGPLAKLGPDPFSDEFAEIVLHGDDGGRIHAMLRDQRRVSGIGRGYSDDILHRAKLSPYRSLKSLSPEERERLLASVHDVLNEGLEIERKREGGLPSKVGDHWIVHGKAGEPCPVCGNDLRRVSYESHEVAYCPTCQTGGKRLADRRLDRLVR